ncbi:MAG: hypothetical protein IJ348_04260 [Alistipes sp.]|nr:hypothetical protein [Alistipes sp.]
MKRFIDIVLVVVGLLVGLNASAQVAKEVEVVRDFAPKVARAQKRSITPNMVDTVKLRPEIDYTITPSSFTSTLNTHRFRPAAVTYWEYQKHYPFYLKLGAGYPINSVADFYATTHRADVGYATAYANHIGQFSKIKVYDPGFGATYNNRSQSMQTRAGVAAGRYFGRYTLAGDVYYQSDMYDRYPYARSNDYDPRDVDYENVAFKASFGDSFADLSRLNFEITAGFDFYHDKSDMLRYEGGVTPITTDRFSQISANAGVRIARNLGGRSNFSVGAAYEGYYGLRDLKHYRNNILSASLLYGYKSDRLLNLKVGATYLYDGVAGLKTRHHVLPYLYVGVNIRDNGGFVPYLEVDGRLLNNSYQELQRRNPYVAMLGYEGMPMMNPQEALPNTTQYNVRFGVSGHTRNSKLAYRLYANMAFIENSLYWYNVNRAFFGAEVARRNIFSVNGAVEYKPVSALLIEAQVKGMIYTTFATVENALPSIEARVALKYTHRKFSIGASADVVGASRWTAITTYRPGETFNTIVDINSGVRVPATVDVGVNLDWHISDKCTLFAEGHNLANMNIYRWVFYREYGANFTVGVKMQF